MVGFGCFHPHPIPAKKVWLRWDPDPAKKVWLRGDPDPETCHEGRKSLIEGTLLMIYYFFEYLNISVQKSPVCN